MRLLRFTLATAALCVLYLWFRDDVTSVHHAIAYLEEDYPKFI